MPYLGTGYLGYNTIQLKLIEEETEIDLRANSSFSDLDLEITPRPSISKFTYRRSARQKETSETTRKTKSQSQTTKRQGKEVEKLNKECEDLQSQLNKANEEIDQLSQSLKTVEKQIKSLKQENEELQHALTESKNAQEAAKQSFEEINLELAQLRNEESSIQTTIIEDDEDVECNNNDESSPSSNFNNTDEESETKDTSHTELSRENLKEIFENLKDLNRQTSLEKESKNQYQRGYKMLKNDFLRYGRKTWNTKTVESYLKLLTNKKDTRTDACTAQTCSDQGLDLLSELFQMTQGLRVSGKILEKYYVKIKK